MKLFEEKPKSISEIIKSSMIGFVIAAFIMLAIVSIVIEFLSVTQVVNNAVNSEGKIATDRVEWAIKSYKNIAEDMGTIPDLSNPEVSVQRKMEICRAKSSEYGLIRIKTINPDGYSDFDYEYRGDRDYFKTAMTGQSVISDPIIAKTDGELILVVAAPLWKDGVYGSEVAGVVFCSIDPSLLSDIVSEIEMTRNTNVRIIGATGNMVASQDLEEVKKQVNYIKLAEQDAYYERVADVERRALNGEEGVITRWNGVYAEMFAVNNIEGTPEWKLIINVPLKDHLKHFWVAILSFTAIIVALCIVISKRSEKIADKISAPFKDIARRLQMAAEGDLSTEVLVFGDTEEIKTISNAARDLVRRLDFMSVDDSEFKSNLSIEDLIDKDTVSSFQEMVRSTTGLGTIIIDTEGKIVSAPSDNTSFCMDYIKQSPIGRERCEQCDRQGAMECIKKETCHYYECHMGLREYASPIMLDGHYIGAILGGQIRVSEEIDRDFIAQKAKEYSLDVDGCLEAAEKIKVWSADELDKIEDALNSTAQVLADIARRSYKENMKNRKQQKRVAIKNIKSELGEKSISSLIHGIGLAGATDIMNPSVNGVARTLEVPSDEHLLESAYDVREVINDAVGDIDARTKGKNIDFLLDVKKELPDKLMGDKDKVISIVNRMIQNAIASTDTGYIRTDVSGIKNGYALFLKIKVRYSGGNKDAIETERMRRYFDKKNVFSLENHTAHEIALITLANIVRKMDGHVDIKENLGHGVTMCVVIPQLEAVEGQD